MGLLHSYARSLAHTVLVQYSYSTSELGTAVHAPHPRPSWDKGRPWWTLSFPLFDCTVWAKGASQVLNHNTLPTIPNHQRVSNTLRHVEGPRRRRSPVSGSREQCCLHEAEVKSGV
jgi:hypothetical protein